MHDRRDFDIGAHVLVRNREWCVLPESREGFLVVRPMHGVDAEISGIDTALETVQLVSPQGRVRSHSTAAQSRKRRSNFRGAESLRDGVEQAIQTLGTGFLAPGRNPALCERLRTGLLSSDDYFRQLQRFVYRILMLLVAEGKTFASGDNLLHPAGTDSKARERFARFYSVGRLLDLAAVLEGSDQIDLNESLKTLFRTLREGYAPLGIPAFGSYFFSPTATADLDSAALSNHDLLKLFRLLRSTDFQTDGGNRASRPVDFGLMDAAELGEIYESLLERQPVLDVEAARFGLRPAEGHERKATGSYYTPRVLIDRLLDSALEPVLAEALRLPGVKSAESALLDLKICDPACGSGHILIAAAERMALHLARLRTGHNQPEPLDIQTAKRDVISHCLYGVDRNPMAVALCQFKLWTESHLPGTPLSFLDHHIRCGNSLLGTTPHFVAERLRPNLPYGVPAEVQQLRELHGFFQWQVEFPDVFAAENLAAESNREHRRGGFDVVLGNPPWVSYTGRQRVEIPAGELHSLRARFPSIARWPASHSAFLALSTEIVRHGGRIGLVLPKQMADLEAYAETRRAVSTLADLSGPVVDVGEDAFPGVTQPVGLFTLIRRAKIEGASSDQWPLSKPSDDPDRRSRQVSLSKGKSNPLAKLVGLMAQRPRFPAGSFADPGVHTGNVARKIVTSIPPEEDLTWAPVREGRDVSAYRCGAPQKWLWTTPALNAGEYYTIRNSARYASSPILVRQTANRPIASRHRQPTYFRNSLLVCQGVAGVPDAVIVAYLNSALYALLHRSATQDANQKAFPQVKVRHLHSLPTIPVEHLHEPHAHRTLGEQLESLVLQAEETAEQGSPLPLELLERIERLVLASFDLPAELAPQLLQAVR